MLELNLTNRAITQSTLGFNSMCNFNNQSIGATSNGLFLLDGYNDNTVEIPALIKSGMINFGTWHLKRGRFFYFDIESTGDLKLSIFCEDTVVSDYTIASTSGDIKHICVPIGSGVQGVWWNWQIENIDGCFFVLYKVDALMIVL